MKYFAKKNYDFTFFSQLCKDMYRKTGTYHLERVPENAKTGTYHIEHVPENAKMGTYHQNVYPKTQKRVHIIQTHVELELLKSLMLQGKINKTKQSSHQMRKTK